MCFVGHPVAPPPARSWPPSLIGKYFKCEDFELNHVSVLIICARSHASVRGALLREHRDASWITTTRAYHIFIFPLYFSFPGSFDTREPIRGSRPNRVTLLLKFKSNFADVKPICHRMFNEWFRLISIRNINCINKYKCNEVYIAFDLNIPKLKLQLKYLFTFLYSRWSAW